jgi:hypothetical protein
MPVGPDQSGAIVPNAGLKLPMFVYSLVNLEVYLLAMLIQIMMVT